jgi:hypothetical protein
MKIDLRLFSLIISLFITPFVSGQIEKINKLDLAFNFGSSLPVASYGKNNPTQSAIWTGSTIKGFAKSKNGFAKIGYEFKLEAKYKINTFLKAIMLIGTYSNSVSTNKMSNYLTSTNYNQEIRAEEVNYRYYYLTPGIEYYYSFKNIELSFNLFCGYSISQYPYYKFILLYTTVDPPVIFAHDGPRPNSGSLLWGSTLSTLINLSNRFKIGLDIQYQMASYSYNVYPRSIPGGSPHQFDFTDKLNVRVFNIGPKFAFCF